MLGTKTYITAKFGQDKAKAAMQKITAAIRQMEVFPELFGISSVSEESERYWDDYRNK